MKDRLVNSFELSSNLDNLIDCFFYHFPMSCCEGGILEKKKVNQPLFSEHSITVYISAVATFSYHW